MTNHTLAHTSWNCKYHIVFAPKYRRKAFYGSRRLEIGSMLRQLCVWQGITIIEAEVCSDHIHMLLEIPPKKSVSSVMGYLKGKSSLMIYDKWGNAKFRYRNREFWCRGYYVDTAGKNDKKIAEYIKNQPKEDAESSQLIMDLDPFTGSK
ncbi:MAG: IS200/IS605 family transposase [Alphaproteobacteria bacterium]|nr:IS200/IS605 family transposase [Alphaproteobacteria bacterium]